MSSIGDTFISTRIDTTESIENIVDKNDNRTLMIILAVILPTLACIILLTLIIICYHRRRTSIWLKKPESSTRLQAIVVNLSSPSSQTQNSEKKLYLSPLPSIQTHTETIIYKRLVERFTSISSVRSVQGETNRAFEAYSMNHAQHTATLDKEFPTSLQAPVRTIDSAFVEAIANHRLSLLAADPNHSLLETSTSTNSSCSNPPLRSLSSSSSTSNTSQTVLLFSQRTQF